MGFTAAHFFDQLCLNSQRGTDLMGGIVLFTWGKSAIWDGSTGPTSKRL